MGTPEYATPVERALVYLSARILNDSWASQHDDVAYYFKAPLAFLKAGKEKEARAALESAERYVEQAGSQSANGAYSGVYPHYPWMWMCWAACELGQHDLARRCFQGFSSYVHPDTSSGLVARPFTVGEPFQADFFATAEAVKFGLLLGKQDLARASAGTILRVLELNRLGPMKEGKFLLRWTGDTAEALQLVQGNDVLHCVNQREPGQLYFMLGFPAMVLLELAGVEGRGGSSARDGYHGGAAELLGYLKECEGVYESQMAHKVARAAALAGDAATAKRIAGFLIKQQTEAGCFQPDPEDLDSVDQTAEIAVWLQQIDQDLAAS